MPIWRRLAWHSSSEMTLILLLETRTGLPDALRVLVEEIPRETWEAHPNFGGMVQFWLERHLMFRRLLDTLETDLQAVTNKDMSGPHYAQRLSRFGGMLLNQLHGHHQIEDMHYFPQLVRLDARIEQGFDLLEADHGAMDGLLNGMAEAANAVLQAGPEAHREIGAFEQTLSGFGKMLDRHLIDEEEIIVPVILKTGFDG